MQRRLVKLVLILGVLVWLPRGGEPVRASNPGVRGNNAPRDAVATLEKRVEQERTGRELFVRDWSLPDAQPADGSDGLGPMFNDVSCVACHQQGGIGGAGQAHKNAHLLHVVAPNGTPLQVKVSPGIESQRALQQAHPDFSRDMTTVVLHRYEGNVELANSSYHRWVADLLPKRDSFFDPATPQSVVERPVRRAHGISVRVTERNTPALFGAGLIDSIPDEAIVAAAERQKKEHTPFISGRVAQTPTGAIGRFGWRGQIASLQEFVMTACAVELGLEVPGHHQSASVVSRIAAGENLSDSDDPPRIRRQRTGPQKLDLSQEQCDALTAYVAGLPAPKSARSTTLDKAKSIQHGHQLFDQVGCSICHTRELGPVTGIFSDLLLHDMGPRLSDPAPAMPEIHGDILSSQSGYFGVSVPLAKLTKKATTNIHQEWRTPPLWGVAVSAPYLHDGRAATLEQAIQWHGGEAQRSAEAFRTLKPDERQDLLNFLQSLTTPGDNPQPQPNGGIGFF